MEPTPRVFAILPTYRRDVELMGALKALALQTVVPEHTYVIDNAGSESCRQVCISVASEVPQLNLEYVDAGGNLGPAGATALGMARVLSEADDVDWMLRCDDDTHLQRPDRLARHVRWANDLREKDPMVAGVGGSGARFDYRRCRLIKPPPEKGNVVEVDYLSTNRWPLFSVQAARSVGVFREDLFFGLTEVEYGLRLRRAGYRLYRIDTDEKRRPSETSARLGVPSWRRFYSIRNMLVIAKEYCGLPTAIYVAIVRLLLKPLANLPREPANAIRHLRLGLRAIWDVSKGRLGRTIEPTMIAGQLDTRSDAQALDE